MYAGSKPSDWQMVTNAKGPAAAAGALATDLLEDRPGHAAGRREDGSLVVHRPEERLAGDIDEGDRVELDADRAGVPDGLPAAGELVHPRAGEPSLECERHALGAVGDRDPQHARRPSDTGRKRRAGGRPGLLRHAVERWMPSFPVRDRRGAPVRPRRAAPPRGPPGAQLVPRHPPRKADRPGAPGAAPPAGAAARAPPAHSG